MKKRKVYGVQTVFMTVQELTEHLRRLDERLRRQLRENLPDTDALAYAHKHVTDENAPQ